MSNAPIPPVQTTIQNMQKPRGPELKLAEAPASEPRFEPLLALLAIWGQIKSTLRESLSARVLLIVLWSGGTTAFGFFAASFGLWIAYIPFLLALLTKNRIRRAALAFGHFAVIAAIACWGLIALGYTPWIVIGAGAAAALTLATLYGALGVAIASIALLALPYMPGNPLLITGALFPGTGLYGLAAVLCLAFVATSRRFPKTRMSILAFIPVVSLFFWDIQDDTFGRFIGVAPDPARTTALDGFELMPVSTQGAQPNRWEMQLALAKLNLGSTIITGENAVQAGDPATIRALCRAVRIGDLKLYLGVQAADGRAEVHLLDAEACAESRVVYRAALGIPSLTGPALPELSMLRELNGLGVEPTPDAPAFLACFEAFSLHRWIALALNGQQSVAVLSNDIWTEPLPIARLRRKVSAQLARLFQIDVAHTNTRTPAVWLLKEKLVADKE